ncbi:hypothetical protein QVD17_27598 [Tagetes erecta]|uniref:CYTH domain-containing protein n=1 Tax=Tagetes erecta TaxID=13708 RepID=A0AAD8K9C5_TARER|nr:hypothetical protein QVD17_27598 [Tagetes erecta]
MEVEVKLRLPNSQTHKTLISLLSPFHITTHNQHNNFFDGLAGELSSRRAVLRIRFYNDQVTKCVISLKAKAVLENGVSRVEEDEEQIDPAIGEECLANPNRLVSLMESSRIMKRVKDEFFGGKNENKNDNDGGLGFVCLGGFKNLRNVYEWKGLVIELDETSYEFGTLYEIECESSEPEKAKGLIEEFLKENEVSYSYSVASKFAIFRAGKLPYPWLVLANEGHGLQLAIRQGPFILA